MTTSSKRSKNKTTIAMAKIDLMFSLILIWCGVSTMLLVKQFHSNTTLQQQLSQNRKKLMKLGKKFDDISNVQDRKVLRHETQHRNDVEENYDYRKFTLVSNQFPFTRNLERFRTSTGFFIYVVQSTDISSPSSALEWSEVRWKDLVRNWGRETKFDDLLQISTRLERPRKDTTLGKGERWMKKKLILHCLPKAASTTLRRACYQDQKDNCPAIDFPVQQDPFGYRNVKDFFMSVKECTDINHFCVQGGDAEMSVINYQGEEAGSKEVANGDEEKGEDANDEREPYHFIHMVPFRNFDDWVESAIKQIFYIDNNCDRVDKLLDQCLGYRELYMELYPKSVLSLLTGMAFDANGVSKDKHHILLYPYKDVDGIQSQVSDFFNMDPLPRTNRRHKESRDEGTCPADISKKFHKCHDETLMNADAIRGLVAEKKRRKQNDRTMKNLLVCLKNGDCGD